MGSTSEPGEGLRPAELGALADLATAENDEIVERALAVAREILGLDLAYMTQFTDDDQVYAGVDGDAEGFAMREGGSWPLEGSYCQRMVLGKIPNLVRDTSDEGEVRDLELTKLANIGAYVGVPITLADGTVYGTICATSHEAAPELADKDVKFMHVLARIIAGQVQQSRLADENKRLRGRVDSLKVEIDHQARRDQVEEIAAGEWFQELSERAQALRSMSGGNESGSSGGSGRMTRIVSVHSFRGGTGKSNLTANLATSLARSGHRVGIIDTDIQSPGIHVLFGVEAGDVDSSLNDFLAERCGIEDAALKVGSRLPGAADGLGDNGRIYLVPSSMDAGAIAQVLRAGYDVSMLAEGVHRIGEALALDTLLIDTHPGLNEETLLAITLSHAMVVVLRPDRQDFQGTAVTVEVARRLEVPKIIVVANNVPASVDTEDLGRQISEAYGASLTAALPHCSALMDLASGGVLCYESPDDPWVAGMESVAAELNGAGA